MKYSNQWLIEKYQQEEQIKFLFFWGTGPPGMVVFLPAALVSGGRQTLW